MVYSIIITSDDKYVVSSSVDRSFIVWSMTTGQRLWDCASRGHTAPIYDIVITQDSEIIISVSRDNTLIVWDFSSGKRLRVIRGHEDNIYSVTVLSDYKTVISGGNSKIILWDLTTDKERKIHFGASDYQQFKDSTKLQAYSKKNHSNKERKRRYYLRHSGVENKRDAIKKELTKSNGSYNAKILSHIYLW